MIDRLIVEKKSGYNVSAMKLKNDLVETLNLKVEDVRIFIRYDIENIDKNILSKAENTIFSETPVDYLYKNELPDMEGYATFVVEYLPGQYDQRADSAMQCVQLLSMGTRPIIKCATIYAVKGDCDINAVKRYIINPVESREGSMELPQTLIMDNAINEIVPIIEGFITFNDQQIADYHTKIGFAMSIEDLKFVRDYFHSENRIPSETELKVIDTYWSDHCRHTTFNTEITKITVKSACKPLKDALELYNQLYDKYNGTRKDKYKCLMDIAVIGAKHLSRIGKLDNLDTSDEINACSIVVNVDVDGKNEEWLIMFKNETHNHPTEIEPFGGAATCLGGAIRDPLSGRTYVYQAMRVTGAADPTVDVKNTLKGKLPQRVISKTAAHGYSSYGNQIGLATGLVHEMYHDGYKAKRLETGFVIAGAPRDNIVRRKPVKGDVIVLLGGETGRDGCGGATGSSKAHTEKSVEVCGAEVQKGNPPTERKIQRLFRNPECSKLIIKCNDFGAGGVSVAIGELADSLDIYLDKVPKKYTGLSGTELAISESQERMAVVLDKNDVKKFIALAQEENLSATEVALVTDTGKMRMLYCNKIIVDLKREFLDTNGVKQLQDVILNDNGTSYIDTPNSLISKELTNKDYISALKKELSRLNICSTKGLGEMFDSTIGAASVLMPFGGKFQLTPSIVMAAKPPVNGNTDTATVSSFGCNPNILSESPFVGAVYSVVASVSKLVASGVDVNTIRLTLQEFFKKLGKDPDRWGEPLAALLGALSAQIGLGTGAIGGKDSMSGTFEQLDVPPTLISFAVGIAKASELIHNTFDYKAGLKIYLIELPVKDGIPDYENVLNLYGMIHKNIKSGNIVNATVIDEGGAIVALAKSCLGNKVGFDIDNCDANLFSPKIGSFVISAGNADDFSAFKVAEIASFNGTQTCSINGEKIKINDLINSYENTLSKLYPTTSPAEGQAYTQNCFARKITYTGNKIAKPRIIIPVFPGTNCEYDTAKAFENAGGIADIFVFNNQSSTGIEESIKELVKRIKKSQIIAFPGGFSGGDEPDGSGKFIATTFKNPQIADAVMELLYKRDGLALGICNGFQALIKLGLVPYGDIREQTADAPTLTFNNISRHISTIAEIRVATNKSPWLNACKVSEVYKVALSHGEGRFVSGIKELEKLIKNGQVATQYVDLIGNATMQSPYNPNGSMNAIEGIISPDGRVLGKMGHAERIDSNLYKNVEGNYDMKIFESGVKYFS